MGSERSRFVCYTKAVSFLLAPVIQFWCRVLYLGHSTGPVLKVATTSELFLGGSIFWIIAW